MGINLIELLPAEDKVKLENYIHLYGVKSNFIGVDKWLDSWAKNNTKLYELLGNNFIYKVPFSYEKTKEELDTQIIILLTENHFLSDLRDFMGDYCFKSEVTREDREPLQFLITDVLRNKHLNENLIVIDKEFKWKKPNSDKELRIQNGIKAIKAYRKILDYFKEDIEEWQKSFSDFDKLDLFKEYEDFRIRHSQILNDKFIKGDMCFSIHPLDYITMSDNASNWESCMNWTDGGCYHVGTVEMMNSNNVICCYVEGSEPFYFYKNPILNNKIMIEVSDEEKELYKWNNKKWRQLFYVTKDIIVSGKAYPYQNEMLTKTALEELRKMAKDNLHRIYSFGIEPYRDMKYIYTTFSMDRIRNHIAFKRCKKHNIIFDTKGMYNDMLNDHRTTYWCIRNKVNHNKIISYSGKAPCLCCGESVLEENEEYSDCYNERYNNVNTPVCWSCRQKYFTCSVCGNEDTRLKHYEYYNEAGLRCTICEKCWDKFVRKCPICGEPMIATLSSNLFAQTTMFEPTYRDLFGQTHYEYLFKENKYAPRPNDRCKPIFMHKHCEKALTNLTEKLIDYSNRSYYYRIGTNYRLTTDCLDSYFFENLESVPPQDGLTLLYADCSE